MLAKRSTMLLLIASLASTVVGCTRTKSYAVAPLDMRDPDHAVTPAPTAAVYTIAWSDDGKSFHPARETSRVVGKHEPLGFELSEGDEIVAVAGAERFCPTGLPATFKKLRWQASFDEPSQLSRNATAVSRGTLHAAGVAAGAVAKFPLQERDSDLCDDDVSPQIRQRQEDDVRDARMRQELGLPAKKPKYGYPRD